MLRRTLNTAIVLTVLHFCAARFGPDVAAILDLHVEDAADHAREGEHHHGNSHDHEEGDDDCHDHGHCCCSHAPVLASFPPEPAGTALTPGSVGIVDTELKSDPVARLLFRPPRA